MAGQAVQKASSSPSVPVICIVPMLYQWSCQPTTEGLYWQLFVVDGQLHWYCVRTVQLTSTEGCTSNAINLAFMGVVGCSKGDYCSKGEGCKRGQVRVHEPDVS